MAKHPDLMARTHHVVTFAVILGDAEGNGIILEYISMEEQQADMPTKRLGIEALVN